MGSTGWLKWDTSQAATPERHGGRAWSCQPFVVTAHLPGTPVFLPTCHDRWEHRVCRMSQSHTPDPVVLTVCPSDWKYPLLLFCIPNAPSHPGRGGGPGRNLYTQNQAVKRSMVVSKAGTSGGSSDILSEPRKRKQNFSWITQS